MTEKLLVPDIGDFQNVEVIEILKNVGEYVYENMKSNNVIISKPKGGFYLMQEFVNKNFSSSSEMC